MLPVPRGYDDALRNCKEAFIRDVWSEHLMALMEDPGKAYIGFVPYLY